MTATTLTDFGAKIEASHQREQCQAFDQHGDRCPYKRESQSPFCPDCDATTALVTVGELRADRSGNQGVYHTANAVKDALRDNYGFDPLDALVLASGSVLSTCFVLEGRLACAAKDDCGRFRVCGHEYTVDRGRELLEQIRTQVTSQTFYERWDGACLAVGRGKIRCSQQRTTGDYCQFHQDLEDGEIRLAEYLSDYGPAVRDGGETDV
jgi:hypothetical protein